MTEEGIDGRKREPAGGGRRGRSMRLRTKDLKAKLVKDKVKCLMYGLWLWASAR